MITDIVTVEKLVDHCVEKIDEIRKYPIEGFLALKRVLQPPVGDIASFVNKSFEQFIIHLLRMKEKKE